MRKSWCVLIILVMHTTTFGQAPVNRQQFFLDDRLIEVMLTTDVKKLRIEKKAPAYQPANISMRFSDTVIITEDVRVQPRGSFRKDNCDMASLMLNFKNQSSPKLSLLKKLKLVGGCHNRAADEELLLKEYLVYKMYNLLTNMSFRVRLLHINYKDSREKMNPYSQYAFLIEDMNDMAARNNCVELKDREVGTESTNRQHMTLVGMFQYMIGNTDWAVPKYHNMKLLLPKNDTLARPYPVAYDFDYSGIVDAPYAIPDEQLGITTVRDRLYRGFPRNMDELQTAIDIFNERKAVIMYTINNFPWLEPKTKRAMTQYLEEFYGIINNKRQVKSIFSSKNP